MRKLVLQLAFLVSTLGFLSIPALVLAQVDFNPSFIISDQEMQSYQDWTRADIQKFLDSKGGYIRTLKTEDINGVVKPAADIIYDAAQAYQINPKFLLVTLQKEQSLVTDDSPTQRQLDWATGYAVCDGCSLSDPKVTKFKGFGKQVDSAASIMRWYYQNTDKSFIKKKDLATSIDNTSVIPQSWATGFLYTYTPHLHGNQNFWRIWNTWFEQIYPNNTLLHVAATDEYWLVQNSTRHKFKTKTALITRMDPRMALEVSDVDLSNYTVGNEIAFGNYSILHGSTSTYLLDNDTLRPFESDEVVRKLGYNPDEVIDVQDSDLNGYTLGSVITVSSTAPEGIVFKITDAPGSYYLLKDAILYPIINKAIIDVNYKETPTENHTLKELATYTVADQPLNFKDGTLLQIKNSNNVFVLDRGKKRLIADDDTFAALGYKRANVVAVDQLTAQSIPSGERLYINASLVSSKNKFLGDSEAPVTDLFKAKDSASYVVAQYPSGRIISGKDIDSRRPIASLTKLLTAFEALNNDFSLTKSTTYTDKKFASEDNTVKLKNNEKILNKDVFNAMLVASINSTARMVAQGTGMSEDNLVSNINHRLADWGADSTSVADVTGLDTANKSTARDLLKIFTKVNENKTIHTALGQATYTFKDNVTKRSLANTNQLFKVAKKNYTIVASKTGYTTDAGGVLAMIIQTKPTKGVAPQQYILITLGNNNYPNRFKEPNDIAQWIISNANKLTLNK